MRFHSFQKVLAGNQHTLRWINWLADGCVAGVHPPIQPSKSQNVRRRSALRRFAHREGPAGTISGSASSGCSPVRRAPVKCAPVAHVRGGGGISDVCEQTKKKQLACMDGIGSIRLIDYGGPGVERDPTPAFRHFGGPPHRSSDRSWCWLRGLRIGNRIGDRLLIKILSDGWG